MNEKVNARMYEWKREMEEHNLNNEISAWQTPIEDNGISIVNILKTPCLGSFVPAKLR
jgi:hypothetical protein